MKIKLSKKKTVIVFSAIISFILILSVYAFYENNFLGTSYYEICDEKIPDSFDGFVIAQISDFHNTHSEILQESLIEALIKEKPDIIVLTGDYIDSRKTDTALSLEYAKKLLTIAPVYMSTGNHEAAAVYEYPSFEEELIALGVKVLRNTCDIAEKNGQFINIMGIDDPVFLTGEIKAEKLKEAIDSVKYDKSVFTVTLSHRPEVFDIYIEKELDLVLSGHAHGGQFRIPFIGGLYIPTEGLFPKYTEGLHKENNTQMIISRGIGASVVPIRINNRPELVIIKLSTE